MNRRALVLASLAALPASTLTWPASAQRRPLRLWPSARRQRNGGLTASHVRTRIVTGGFASYVPITIPAPDGPASPYPFTIPVSGFSQGRILKVRVGLFGFGHDAPDDVDIMVAEPGNTGGAILLSDIGAVATSVAST